MPLSSNMVRENLSVAAEQELPARTSPAARGMGEEEGACF